MMAALSLEVMLGRASPLHPVLVPEPQLAPPFSPPPRLYETEVTHTELNTLGIVKKFSWRKSRIVAFALNK